MYGGPSPWHLQTFIVDFLLPMYLAASLVSRYGPLVIIWFSFASFDHAMCSCGGLNIRPIWSRIDMSWVVSGVVGSFGHHALTKHNTAPKREVQLHLCAQKQRKLVFSETSEETSRRKYLLECGRKSGSNASY